ncbi:hypothetical protein D9756_005118 [Leucocoprinus leucothites]|uniref:NmrA-like domain-containing protein n=1 Tax=Leucocoprinus leucothites TaxID=201217 RepID=A0A8H5G980_9AGAR|nr:hypothetical protein D9756_005118 [Leucoagaricus leucothites]
MPHKVAVASVTNGLGHAITSALLDTADIDVVLLTRSSSPNTGFSKFTSRGAIVNSVDYSSIPNLTSVLDGVDTVISTMFTPNDPLPTLNLITAAKTAGVRRFAPSEFASSTAGNARFDIYEFKRQIQSELKRSGLEYTLFQNGIFMDYFAFGAPKPHEGPLKMFPYIVDIASHKAIIPGTGDEKVTFTTVEDVGRFVAAAVKLERWPEELGMAGETTTYNQVIRDAEAVTGRKFEVQYLDKGQITKAMEESKGDPMKLFMAQAMDVLADGLGAVEPTLNRLVPHVTITSVKDYISKYWI